MGRLFPRAIALRILVAMIFFAASEGQSLADARTWPFAVTGVTPEMVGRMQLPLRDRLLDLADKYGERTDVPYVWGGDAIGDPSDCEACRACVMSQKKSRVKSRLKVCAPCRSCGIDCSHFATRFFREAGMDLPFATTGAMKRMTKSALKEKLGLVDVGRNLADARPGDILLHNHHMTILLKLHSATNGDVLHASRSYKRGRLGGIEIARDKNLLRFRGRLIKILRRVELMDEDAASPPQLASHLRSE